LVNLFKRATLDARLISSGAHNFAGSRHLIAKANPRRIAARWTATTRLIRAGIVCRLRNDTFAPQFPTRDKAEHTSQTF
jgi:hypothetical protein